MDGYCSNWGRVGEPGASNLAKLIKNAAPMDEAAAIKEFEKVFLSKTKNTYGAEPYQDKGKYVVVETADDDGGGEGGDVPRLSEAQIQKGQEVLVELREAVTSLAQCCAP